MARAPLERADTAREGSKPSSCPVARARSQAFAASSARYMSTRAAGVSARTVSAWTGVYLADVSLTFAAETRCAVPLAAGPRNRRRVGQFSLCEPE
jgi:hypothetical protein